MASFARPELLASPDWLAENLGRPEVRVVDVRWRPDGTGRASYAAEHIPGATHVDWQLDLIDQEDAGASMTLGGPEQVSQVMSRAGVGDGSTLVLYDDTASLHAAWVWWCLRAYGFESTRILDGGFPAWIAEDRPVAHVPTAPEAATFTPHARLRVRLTTADLRGLIGSEGLVLLDARAPAEYQGLEGNARRLGHIPGAVNVPVVAMTRPGSQTFRSADEIRRRLSGVGLQGGRRIVCYDGSGISSAKLAFVLTLLGHDDVGVYEGGWSEWGNRLDLPVDR